MTSTAAPLDDFRALAGRLPPRSETAALGVAARTARLSGQGVSLGRAGDIAEWLAGWSGRTKPVVARPVVAVFAATHCVAARRVGRHAPGHEQRLVEHCAAGGSAISQFCGSADIGLKVFDLALDLPTGDIVVEDALDARGCAATIAFGMEAVAGGADLVVIGQIGEGAGVAAAAILAALLGGEPGDWLEPSADRALTERQREAVTAALARCGAVEDPLEILFRLGGRDIAAIAGAIVAARTEKIPVVLDGFAALSAAAVLHALDPQAVAHCMLSQVPARPAAPRAAKVMGLKAVLDLGIGDEEGLAGAMAASLIRDIAAMHGGMVSIVA
jgi:nicotinate-nucleotide--dimethylbenzimidazole phosphoribosyltransferase